MVIATMEAVQTKEVARETLATLLGTTLLIATRAGAVIMLLA